MFGASPFCADPFSVVAGALAANDAIDAGDWERYYRRRKKRRQSEIDARAQVDAAFAAWLALFTAKPVPRAPPAPGPQPVAAPVSVSPVERVLAVQATAATVRRHEARAAYDVSSTKAQQARDRIDSAVVRYKISHAKAQFFKSKRARAHAAYLRSKTARWH